MTIRRRPRATTRHIALDALSLSDNLTGAQERGLVRKRVHFPYLHAVPRREESNFRALVAALAEDHTFIGYSEAIRRVSEGDIDRPYVSFSFDDGFKSNMRAAGILEEFGATGMFFVPTGFIGTRTVSQAREFFGFSEGCNEPAMSWADLEMLRKHGHEVGNHTHTHRIQATLSEDESAEDIGIAAEQLRDRLGECRHFAWPYGRFFHFTDYAARAVFNTGHKSCASAERGAHSASGPVEKRDLCVRRDHVMTSWPLRHNMYFIAKSSRDRASDGAWPAGWQLR